MSTNVQTTVNTLVNKNLTNVAVSQMQSIVQENEQFNNNNQQVTIVIDGKLSCASLTITQEAKVSMRALNVITVEQQATMLAALQQHMNAAVKDAVEQTNKDLSFGQTNISTLVTTTINDTTIQQASAMSQSLKTTIQQTNTTNQDINFFVGENGEVLITGPHFF